MLSFRLGRVPVAVRLEFLFVALLGGFRLPPRLAFGWAGIVFVSILLHELGHAGAMAQFGFRARVELHALGGTAYWPVGAHPAARERLVVSLAGPGTQLVLGAIVWAVQGLLPQNPDLEWAVRQVLWVNVGWALLNLLPMLPWDGGNVLDTLGEIARPNGSTRWVGVVSMCCGAGVFVVAAMRADLWIAYFAFRGAEAGWRRWKGPALPVATPALRVELARLAQTPATNPLETLREHLDAGRPADAEALARQLLPFQKRDDAREAVTGILAHARLAQGDADDAERVLGTLTRDRRPLDVVARIAAFRGNHSDVVELLWEPARLAQLQLYTWPLLFDTLLATGAADRVRSLVTLRLAPGLFAGRYERSVVESAVLALRRVGQEVEAFAIASTGFEVIVGSGLAFQAAVSAVRLGQLDEAVSWLRRAVNAGFSSRAELEAHADFAHLRARRDFQSLVAGLPPEGAKT